MLSYIKNSDGYILGYLEWQVVNVQGQFKDDGEYCYIQDYWIHPLWRSEKYILAELSQQIAEHKFSKNLKWIYWNREKYNYRKSKIYKKEKFIGGHKCLKDCLV